MRGLFLYFQSFSMKKWSYTLGSCCVGKNVNCQISHPEAAHCGNRGHLESRINILQLLSRAAPQHKARRVESTTGSTAEGGGQRTMKNGGQKSPPHTHTHKADDKMMTASVLGSSWQEQNYAKTGSWWERKTDASCQALKKRKKLNLSLWWVPILKRMLRCWQRIFFLQTGLRVIRKIWTFYSLTSKNIILWIFPG